MFRRDHHRRIAKLLESLDADRLVAHGCWFGGGTAIALRFGEYRESVDVDFLVSSRDGYRDLRLAVTGSAGLGALCRSGCRLEQTREIRADQYGVRTMVHVDGVDIKLEIVAEARIELERPRAEDSICGIATLTPLDLAASKLLANSDRWADDAVTSRDLIDLAMMRPSRALLRAAIAKASGAYGGAIERDLSKAINALRERPNRLATCMRALQIDAVPPALLWQYVRALSPTPGA